MEIWKDDENNKIINNQDRIQNEELHVTLQIKER